MKLKSIGGGDVWTFITFFSRVLVSVVCTDIQHLHSNIGLHNCVLFPLKTSTKIIEIDETKQ